MAGQRISKKSLVRTVVSLKELGKIYCNLLKRKMCKMVKNDLLGLHPRELTLKACWVIKNGILCCFVFWQLWLIHCALAKKAKKRKKCPWHLMVAENSQTSNGARQFFRYQIVVVGKLVGLLHVKWIIYVVLVTFPPSSTIFFKGCCKRPSFSTTR